MAKRSFRLMSVVGVVVLGAAGALLLWLLRNEHCYRACEEALERGTALADKGQLRTALHLLDEADASCDCMQFTEGDEPPEHAAARVWLQSLEAREGRAALDELVPRGPILKIQLRDDNAGSR